MKPAQKRAVVRFFRARCAASERRACRVAGAARSSCRYRSQARDQTALRLRLRDLAAARVRDGYRRIYVLLRHEGWRVNRKRVYRLYREGLAILVTRRKKRASAPRVHPPAARRPRERWSLDLLADGLASGRRFRVPTLVDHVSRVSPAIAVGTALTGERVAAMLEELAGAVGCPQRLRVDNGPEFVSPALDAWADRRGVELVCGRPGKPTDNPFVEAFNGRFRDECLDQHWFASLEEARQTIEDWRLEDNAERPHGSLGQQTPAEFAARWYRERELLEVAD